jgi:hypothetical protein
MIMLTVEGSVGFELVIMKSIIFSDIMLWVRWKSTDILEEHLQGRRINQPRNRVKQVSNRAWRWRRRVPPKRRFAFSWLHGHIPEDKTVQWRDKGTKGKAIPCNRPWRPIGLWDVEAPTFSGQSPYTWRWGCQPYSPAAFSPQEDSWYSFC